MRAGCAGAAIVIGIMSGSGAFAYVPEPDSAQIADAVDQGVRLAAAHDGYPSKDYLVHRAKDTLALDPDDGDVDAVLLATPLERTRHAAFMGAYTGHPITAAEARSGAELPDKWLEVIVFAHGNNDRDRKFGEQFGTATLDFPGRSVASVSIEHSKPDRSQYPHTPRDSERFVGTVTYKFDLTWITITQDKPVTLAFDDPSGKHFEILIDLTRFP